MESPRSFHHREDGLLDIVQTEPTSPVLLEESILSSNILSSTPTREVRRAVTTYTAFNVPAEHTNIFYLPRRVFRWIYSISLVILMMITVAFIAVTPIDVIVQTSGTSFSGVKLFIVIAVCVVFIVLTLFLYFSRIFQYRVAMNDIPTKSVYIPIESDMPKEVYGTIEKKLQECVGEIKVKAGPLYNPEIINNPGVAPPEYIQKRNRDKGSNGEGTLLPPDSNYEDVIRSLGDKFRHDSKVFTQVDLPPDLSFREIIIYLSEIFMRDTTNIPKDRLPNLPRIIQLYEKFRFGPNLIKEGDLFEFMVEFDKLGQICQSNYENRLPKSRRISRNRSNRTLDDIFSQSINHSDIINHTDMPYYQDDVFPESEEENGLIEYEDDSESSVAQFYHQQPLNQYYNRVSEDNESSISVVQPSKTLESAFDPMASSASSIQRHNNSVSSTKSVIRNRLALGNRNVSFEGDTNMTAGADTTSLADKRYSGYVTDSEDDAGDFYQFRRKPRSESRIGAVSFSSSKSPEKRSPSRRSPVR
ncbi:uncharacterized protein RJT20DRAFT_96280 [Scheffersomyces xylosifermentans]|uniref:uncharacterized protein n=1 Tax=Scheffersomyces xylosifermentans TaxID=1304137 RepID=UPI00315CB1CC